MFLYIVLLLIIGQDYVSGRKLDEIMKDKIAKFKKYDKNNDQQLTYPEVKDMFIDDESVDLSDGLFTEFDKDKSNTISLKEFFLMIYNDFDESAFRQEDYDQIKDDKEDEYQEAVNPMPFINLDYEYDKVNPQQDF